MSGESRARPPGSDCEPVVPKGFELIDGELVEKAGGALSSFVSGRIFSLLSQVCKAGDFGLVFPPGLAYRCFAPDVVLRPDLSFVRRGRMALSDDDARVAPDLAGETAAPGDGVWGMERRVEEFLRAGTPLVWVVVPVPGVVMVYRRDGSVTRLRRGQDLSGEDVVPGFRVPLDDLFSASCGL